jgi:S1-C subfamily serine protease
MKRLLPLLLATACAGAAPEPEAPPQDSLLPGNIGIAVKGSPTGLVVAAVKRDGDAAAAGVRAGDVVLRYNGAPVSSLREFNRLVLGSPPGSVARVELLRDGDKRQVEVPVRELDTMPRV